MHKGRVRVWLVVALAVMIAWVMTIACLFGLFVAWRIRQPYYRELRPNEIRPWFKLITGRELPEKTEGLRGILYFFRDREIFVAFQTDQQGCSYILDTFGGQDVQVREFVKERDYVFPLAGFVSANYWQKKLGISLFDPQTLGVACYLDSGGHPDTGYQVLIDKDRSKVYIYSYRRGDRWLPFRVWLRQEILCY